MELTTHFRERWATRIEGVKHDGKTLANYVNATTTHMTLDVLDKFEKAVYLWQGDLVGRGEKTCFHIYDNIIFVSNNNKTRLVTCYRVELPFPEPVVKTIIRKSIDSIIKLKAKGRTYNDKWIPWYKKKQEEQQRLQEEIRKLQTRISQISTEMDEKREYTDKIDSEVEEYARILCNSIQFKSDVDKGGLKV